MEIRPVRPEEYAAVGELTLAAYDDGGFVSRTDSYASHLTDVEDRATKAVTWVAVDGAEVLGAVTYCPTSSPYREVSVDDSEAEFRMLAVAPGARGRGIGEALVRHCLDTAAAEGRRRVVLCSMAEMRAAHRIYQRLGFTRLPDRDWSPHDTDRDVQLLGFVKEL
jgi:ribosomal protein S18 acetylase RimI-like enzyme